MVDPQTPVDLAERVASVARGLGIETAVIGAYALAVYGYVRATTDLDLATVASLDQLQRLAEALRDEGLQTRLSLPDDLDVLGGVLRVWIRIDEDGDPFEPIEVINFFNPHRPRRAPAADAVSRAIGIAERPALRYVQLDDLIALKLDAGSRADLADVVELLKRNASADRATIRATSKRYGFDVIDVLIAEADAG